MRGIGDDDLHHSQELKSFIALSMCIYLDLSVVMHTPVIPTLCTTTVRMGRQRDFVTSGPGYGS